ncbi:class I adenylate-forming enzyme family protein, partial [Rhizobiaceae sp. 2RAB30]
VMNGYGLTEAMGFSTFTAVDDGAEIVAGTVGRFDPRIEWRLVDEDGRAVAEGEPGEIQMRGDWLFSGYFRRPEATSEAFAAGGWFRTGDLAEIAADGNVRLVGRSKEMFKSGGYNVFPLEVEQALEAVDGIVMAVVVPVPDAMFHEVGYAFVVAAGDGAETGHLKEQLRRKLANYKIPKHFEVVEALPMLPIGKVDRLSLKRRAHETVGTAG